MPAIGYTVDTLGLQGHLSTCPYVIATGTTGAAFGSELLNIVGAGTETGAACAKMVGDAVGYMASLISPSNATIPYVIDCQPPDWASCTYALPCRRSHDTWVALFPARFQSPSAAACVQCSA